MVGAYLRYFFLGLVFCFELNATQLQLKTFMPENDLHLDKSHKGNDMTEEQFDQILNEAEKIFSKVIEQFNAKLKINHYWTNATVNASAMQVGDIWHLNMYGGLAKRAEVTKDGFALVVCHELGHHIGGVPFKGAYWAASEGQSDYFATIACTNAWWTDQVEENKKYQEELLKMAGGEDVKKDCDQVFEEENLRNMCYRKAVASKSVSNLLAALGGKKFPEFNTPDKEQVGSTFIHHPQAQCRLDTYLAGGLCDINWDFKIIPGKEFTDRLGLKAYIQAAAFSCHDYKDRVGARPKCWFNPEDIKLPIIDILDAQEEAEVATDEVKELQSYPVSKNDMVTVTMEGTGDADLYVRYNQMPTEDEFDCRPFQFGSSEKCSLKIPDGVDSLHLLVKGWSKESKVSLKLAVKSTSKLCRNYNGGAGEQFKCFGDFECKKINETAEDTEKNWCIVY